MIVSKIEIKGHFVQWLYSQSEELLSQSLACYTTKQSVFLRIQVHASSQTKGLERAENRERDARVRLARFARVRLFRHTLPISLLILRKKPTVLQSTSLSASSPFMSEAIRERTRERVAKPWGAFLSPPITLASPFACCSPATSRDSPNGELACRLSVTSRLSAASGQDGHVFCCPRWFNTFT